MSTVAKTTRRSYGGTYLALAVLLAGAVIASASIGAFMFSPREIARFIGEAAGWIPAVDSDTLGRNVFLKLRLPRVLMSGQL